MKLSFRWAVMTMVWVCAACDAGDFVDGAGGWGPGGGGAGGIGSTGGVSGGTGGTGGASRLPSCLRDLFAACPTDGRCKTPSTSDSRQRQYCYANGVTTDSTRTGSCDGAGHVAVEVRKADGTLCYRSEVRQGVICEGESFTWTDAAGNVVATGSQALGMNTVTCTSGETGACTDSHCSLGSVWRTESCEAGACP